MTKRARIWLCAAILVAVIGGEAVVAWRQQRTLAFQERSLETLERRAARVLAERARVRRELRSLPAAAEATETMPAENAASEGAAAAWIARVHRLRGAFAADPARWIPELECLKPAEWLDLTQSAEGTGTDDERLRATLARIRGEAKFAFLERMQEALVLYCHAHEGELPGSVAQLAEFFETPPPGGALARYAMARSGKIHAVGAREPILVERALADELHDSRYSLAGAPGPLDAMPFVRISPSAQAVNQFIERAQHAFALEHSGEKAARPEQLAPFFHGDDGVSPADVAAFWDSPLRKK